MFLYVKLKNSFVILIITLFMVFLSLKIAELHVNNIFKSIFIINPFSSIFIIYNTIFIKLNSPFIPSTIFHLYFLLMKIHMIIFISPYILYKKLIKNINIFSIKELPYWIPSKH